MLHHTGCLPCPLDFHGGPPSYISQFFSEVHDRILLNTAQINMTRLKTEFYFEMPYNLFLHED